MSLRFAAQWLFTATVVLGGAAVGRTQTPPIAPGPQASGGTLLHSQWSIRPAGRQVELGYFPVNLAVDPSGKYAAVLHASRTVDDIRIVNLATGQAGTPVPIHEAFYGLAFSPDGTQLICSGGTDDVLRVFNFHEGQLTAAADLKIPVADKYSAVAGVTLTDDGRTAFASVLFSSQVVALELKTGRMQWTTRFDPAGSIPEPRPQPGKTFSLIDLLDLRPLVHCSNPLAMAYDARRRRVFVSLWGESAVAVLDAADGRVIARWPVGLHPNELLLARDGGRLFVSNGGLNTISVMDPDTGQLVETLSSSLSPGDRPGSTPDSLALSRDGRRLFVANADNNDVAVFDVSVAGKGRALGFIPTGWFPTSVRLSPTEDRLLVVSARGLAPKANNIGETTKFTYVGGLYRGSLAIVDLPRGGWLHRAFARVGFASPLESPAFGRAMERWTAAAELGRPAPPAPVVSPDNPVPAHRGAPSPIRYVIYVIKENRTYDQVFGDLPSGNGDPNLCLFGEAVTPNLHKIARQFVLLDNFYANAEISVSGHEWSMGAYASEFVEKTWPAANYDPKQFKMPYPAEGRFAAAVPALGYLWDRAQAAGVSYRSYGEFIVGAATAADPATADLPALVGHVDPLYHGWDLDYSDADRATRFIAELHRFEGLGDMPRLQILRLPNDHTKGAVALALRPRAMVAQNDLAVGRLVEAVSHSRFWPQTAIFIVEDDAQNGPDHVDAHRTEALIVSPYTRRQAVDSTPYTTCSMLATMELILGLEPMSQFDAAAGPMRASFQAAADPAPFAAEPARIDLNERNPAGGSAAITSARLNFSHEDAIDDQVFNHVIWAAERGPQSVMPAPVHAAFVRQGPVTDDD